MQYRKSAFLIPQWSSPARQALISIRDAKSRCMIHRGGALVSRGEQLPGYKPMCDFQTAAHRPLKPKKNKGLRPRERFLPESWQWNPLTRHQKEQALLFSKLYKLQANWRPQDTPIRSSAAGRVQSSSKRRTECWCLLSFQQPCYLPKSNCLEIGTSATAHQRTSLHVIHYHAPSQLDLIHGGKQLCLWHSWIPVCGKDSEVCCFFLVWKGLRTLFWIQGYQPKDEPQVKKLVIGGSAE